MDVRNRLKGLDLIDRLPDELWTEVCDIVQKTGIKTNPKRRKKKIKNKMAVSGFLIHSCEMKKSKKKKRKAKIQPLECRVPKNSKER